MAGIFTNLDFTMQDCSLFPLVKLMIEKEGGALSFVPKPGAIELVPFQANYELKTEPVEPVYSYKLVQDSAMVGQLQPFDNYRIKTSAKPQVKVSYQTLLKQGRSLYSEEDDQVIKTFVLLHPGKPNSLAYWRDALSKGLGVQHSDESLRQHWRQLNQPKETLKEMKTPPSRRRQANKYSFVKRVSFTKDNLGSMQPIEEAVTEEQSGESGVSKRKHSPDVSDSRKRLLIKDAPATLPQSQDVDIKDISDLIKVKVMNDGSRQILNITKLEQQCKELDVPNQFQKLVDRCRKASRQYLEETEVLAELRRQGGRVVPTIARFLAN
jgi:hypothetical protein